ncbi:MAG: iron-sulfur cluster assembly accessory protein [Synergistetes bacterium]|nr:iron-sulfur cluster assembly accessory protein [Synergistota bacterium]MDW8192945.1 iron-sulfur cluster assembly accessory protein [Synergistota bacterium]
MLSITDKAMEEFKKILSKYSEKAYGVRIFLLGSSCSCCGPSYHLTLTEKGEEGDKLIEKEGIKIFLDPIAYNLLSDSIIDYKDGFVIEKASPQEA